MLWEVYETKIRLPRNAGNILCTVNLDIYSCKESFKFKIR